jgi:hypothetical protein
VWVAGIEHGTDIVSGKTVEALLSGNLDFDGRKSVQPITEHETTVDTRIGFTDVFRSSTRSSSPGTTIQTSSFPASVTETSKKTNGATENISLSRRLSRRDIGLILGLVFGGSAVFFCIILIHRFFHRSFRKRRTNLFLKSLEVPGVDVSLVALEPSLVEVSRFSVDS